MYPYGLLGYALKGMRTATQDWGWPDMADIVYFGHHGGHMTPARSARRRRNRTFHNKHTRHALKRETSALLAEALAEIESDAE